MKCRGYDSNFEERNGPRGAGFIHVHHLKPLLTVGEAYDVDPMMTRALDAPWEQWAIFLHPAQRTTVERIHNGLARTPRQPRDWVGRCCWPRSRCPPPLTVLWARLGPLYGG